MNNKLFRLPSELLTRSDIDRISEMFSSPKKMKKSKSKSSGAVRAIVCPVINDTCYNIWSSEIDISMIKQCESLMGHRAIAISRYPAAVAMKFRSCSFGKGIANDIPLDLFGNCNYVSAKHAIIFYDEIDHDYKLINYSCYGSYVDDTFAANNEMSNYQGVKEEGQVLCQYCPCQDEHVEYRNIKVGNFRRNTSTERFSNCLCIPSECEKLNNGWEGSLKVRNGSVLRFGCISFIFIVIDHAE